MNWIKSDARNYVHTCDDVAHSHRLYEFRHWQMIVSHRNSKKCNTCLSHRNLFFQFTSKSSASHVKLSSEQIIVAESSALVVSQYSLTPLVLNWFRSPLPPVSNYLGVPSLQLLPPHLTPFQPCTILVVSVHIIPIYDWGPLKKLCFRWFWATPPLWAN